MIALAVDGCDFELAPNSRYGECCDLLCLLDALANEAGLERRRRFGLVVATGIIIYLLTGLMLGECVF